MIPYGEVLRPAQDRSAVEAAWRLVSDRACEHRVLPDGRCDIILRFASDGAKPKGAITPMIAGPATRFQIVSIAAGTGYVGVRLRPGAARDVLGMDLRAIANALLVGEAALAKAPALAALCAPAPSLEALGGRLDRFVAGRGGGRAIDPLTAGLIDSLHVTGGRLPVAELARLHGAGVRTVHRRIVFSTGLSPKEMAMVIQFHRALRLRFDNGLGLAAVALEAGYADQAHMSRAFRRLGGVSPARPPDMVLPRLPI